MKRKFRWTTLLVVVALLISLVAPAPMQAASSPFTDMAGSRYETVVTTLWSLGVVTGMEANKYGPEGSVTRAQMAALITRAMGKSAEADALKSVASPFSDVPQGHWAQGVITLSSRMNIVKGDGDRFMPNDPVNYAQVATMLVRALGYENQVIGGYPSGYVIKANELGLLRETKFELFGPVNRAEAALMLYNAVFNAPAASSGNTWSQTVFKRAVSLAFDAVPAYAAPGQQIELNAMANDAAGKPIPNPNVTYRVTAGSGLINGRTLTVNAGGRITVEAQLGDLRQSVNITPVSDLIVDPATFQANKGGTIQLSATALADGRRIAVEPVWRVKQGSATVNDKGLVTVQDYGSITVEAKLGSMTATSTGQAVGKITITQKPEYLTPGGTFTFAAVATDSAGQPINVPITWSTTGGQMDPTTGRLSNPAGAQVTVRATAAGISDSVTVPMLQSIAISPDSPTLLTGRQMTFTAEGVDSTGKRYPITPVWNRTDSSIGVIAGDGTFAGTNSGTTTITASLGSLTGRTTVRVGGQATRLSLTAGSTTVPLGSGLSTTIEVKMLDQAGNVSPVDDQPITFALTDTTGGRLSRTLVLTRQGVASISYTAGNTAGTATILASAPGTAISNQSVLVSTYTQVPAYIELAVSPQPLATGGGVALVTATLRDSSNFPVASAQPLNVMLTASGTPVGALTGSAIAITAGQSSGSLSFISSSVTGSMTINGSSSYPVRPVTLQTREVGPASGVKIHPIKGTTPVTGLTSLQVEVDVRDTTGMVRATDNSTQVQLSVTGPTTAAAGQAPAVYTATAARGTATFQVQAYMVGTVTLTASLPGVPNSTTDTATAEFVPGVLSNLRLTATPATLLGDGFSTGQVVAEVVDGNGTVIPNVNPLVTFRKLVDGGATTALSPLTVQATGGRAVLSLQSVRSTGTDQWYATAPGLDTINLASIATTASSGDAYTLRVAGSTNFNVGGSGTLVIQVVDQQGRIVTGDSGRVITALHNINGVTMTPTVTTQNGTAAFVVTSTRAASGSVTFTAGGLTVPTITAVLNFGTSGSAYSLFPSSTATTAQVGTPITITIRVMDSQGSLVSGDYGRVISASIEGYGTLSDIQSSTVSGIATFTVTGFASGTATVTFSAPGLPQATTSILLQFTD